MAQGPRPLLAETFLHLDPHDRREVYAAAAAQLSYPDFVLEKDTWICWALDALFSAGGYEMAFKGGTSLSKVFDAIRRFSEDIDLTVMVPSARFGEGEIPTSAERPRPPSGGPRWRTHPVPERPRRARAPHRPRRGTRDGLRRGRHGGR